MTAPIGSYSEIDAVEGYNTFEGTDEAIRGFAPNRVFVAGGLSSATLNTPKGPATLNLPSPVPTLTQFRALEQAVNTNNQRVTAELARLRQTIASSRPGLQGMGMMPLIIGIMGKNRFDTHSHPGDNQPPNPAASGDSSFSLLLPLLLLQPGLLGQVTGAPRTTSNGQDAISPLLMAFVLAKFLNTR